MEGREYRNLNLNRSSIEQLSRDFIEANNFGLANISPMPGAQNGIRVVFTQAGQQPATVDIYYNQDGTSSIRWQTGKNHPLSELLADHLFDTLNPSEFENVNMVIQGIVKDQLDAVLELTSEQANLEIKVHSKTPSTIVWKIVSTEFQDELTISFHVNTFNLQIQGRPLSCYRVFIFNLTSLLDLNGLEKVLLRQDDSRAEIVQQDVAREWLKGTFGESYNQLPMLVEKLLTSGLCVKLAAPKLPDYSMLIYPELRALEGILKEQLSTLGIVVDRDFGGIFTKNKGRYGFDLVHAGKYPPEVEDIVCEAYDFYRKERHGLFHMETAVNTSRALGTLPILMEKSKIAWEHMKKLYSFKK
ncbi:type II toxin-antitoxin system RnlA family toxin [Shewanella sp. HN-41]|uniref:type II toxin-antitoxin system RnlA family toxin n=1 Tax=Shewanella sp. HN-41 TaxID=327275 RepID=UPI0002126721|nr:type II toxin-antitoxin system RnlA family toxin [Shewanella sp. HN-41]EGM70204.1 putative cell division protein [Shewanella sp. HN-41]